MYLNGREIRKLRKALNINTTELAAFLDTTSEDIRKLEYFQHSIPALNCCLAEILTYLEQTDVSVLDELAQAMINVAGLPTSIVHHSKRNVQFFPEDVHKAYAFQRMVYALKVASETSDETVYKVLFKHRQAAWIPAESEEDAARRAFVYTEEKPFAVHVSTKYLQECA